MGLCWIDGRRPFALAFAVRRPTGDRWLIVAVLPTEKGS
jgi:hypothetical protein